MALSRPTIYADTFGAAHTEMPTLQGRMAGRQGELDSYLFSVHPLPGAEPDAALIGLERPVVPGADAGADHAGMVNARLRF